MNAPRHVRDCLRGDRFTFEGTRYKVMHRFKDGGVLARECDDDGVLDNGMGATMTLGPDWEVGE